MSVSIPVGTPLPPIFTQTQPTMGDILVSTGGAIAGIGTTAMGALLNTQAGIVTPLVLTPIAKSPYR